MEQDAPILTADQSEAASLIEEWFFHRNTQIFVLCGYAGTGKTFLVDHVVRSFPALENYFPEDIAFVTSQELEDAYPALTPKAREREAVKAHGAVFLKNIGGRLRSGAKHDGRAPDYDDWGLNGDILVYYPPLDCAFELSSMGIRVDETSLLAQLEAEHCTERLAYPFHRALAAGELPLTMGGGIGQSRLCMIMLNKVHIGEVQVSVWDKKTRTYCKDHNIPLM